VHYPLPPSGVLDYDGLSSPPPFPKPRAGTVSLVPAPPLALSLGYNVDARFQNVESIQADDIAHPKRGDTLQLPLMAEPPNDVEAKAAPKPGHQNDVFGELK
jgi:hypothetical protein